MFMPICEICGLEIVETHKCKECEAKFCEECGNVKAEICFDCLGWMENGEENEDWLDQDLN